MIRTVSILNLLSKIAAFALAMGGGLWLLQVYPAVGATLLLFAFFTVSDIRRWIEASRAKVSITVEPASECHPIVDVFLMIASTYLVTSDPEFAPYSAVVALVNVPFVIDLAVFTILSAKRPAPSQPRAGFSLTVLQTIESIIPIAALAAYCLYIFPESVIGAAVTVIYLAACTAIFILRIRSGRALLTPMGGISDGLLFIFWGAVWLSDGWSEYAPIIIALIATGAIMIATKALSLLTRKNTPTVPPDEYSEVLEEISKI